MLHYGDLGSLPLGNARVLVTALMGCGPNMQVKCWNDNTHIRNP
jgi:hypothetical protein